MTGATSSSRRGRCLTTRSVFPRRSDPTTRSRSRCSILQRQSHAKNPREYREARLHGRISDRDFLSSITTVSHCDLTSSGVLGPTAASHEGRRCNRTVCGLGALWSEAKRNVVSAYMKGKMPGLRTFKPKEPHAPSVSTLTRADGRYPVARLPGRSRRARCRARPAIHRRAEPTPRVAELDSAISEGTDPFWVYLRWAPSKYRASGSSSRAHSGMHTDRLVN